jgi:restriction endonuclease S subunit
MIFRNSKGTKEVKISETNELCNEIKELTTLKIEDIKKEPAMSLNYFDYLKSDDHKDSKLEWVEFGKVFTLEKGTLQSSKVVEDEKSNVIFIGKGEVDENKTIKSDTSYNGGAFIANAFNGNEKCPIRYTDKSCIHSDLMLRIIVSDDYENKINIKFMYYYLKHNQEYIEKNYKIGSCNKSLDIKNFNRMKIPIPPIEEQNKIVEQLDRFFGYNEKYYDLIDILEKNLDTYIDTVTITIKIKKWVSFGEIFTLEKGTKHSSYFKEDVDGEGVLISKSDRDGWRKINKKDCNCNGKNLFIAEQSNTDDLPILYYNGLCASNEFIYKFNINIDYVKNINITFYYYYLKLNKENLKKYARGPCYKHLDVKNFIRMEIPVPPIEEQNEIVKNCEMFQNRIDDIKQIISINDNFIKNIFESIK